MHFKRRNRERKEISRKVFQLTSIVLLLQSFPFSTAENDQMCIDQPMGAAFEDPTDCTGYFVCIFNDANHMNCPLGQIFHTIDKTCVNGQCGSTTEQTISTESSSTSTGTLPTLGTECSNEPYCQASENGTFHRDRKDCSKFYVCKHGEALAESCAKGFYFDEVTNACNFPSLVSCSPSTNEHCTSKPTEPSSSTASTEPPTTSTSEPTSTEVPTEPSTSTEPPTTTESSTSEPTISTETSSRTSPSSSPGTECSNEPYCQTSEHGTFHRDRNDCRKYYVCRNGVAVAESCEKGFYFDEVTNACNFPSLVSCSPSTNEHCTSKPTEPSSSAPSTEPPTTSTSEPTSTEAPTEPSTSTEPPTTTESSTSEPTISTESSSSSTKVTSSSETSTSSPGAECSNEPYCQASEHGTFHRDRNDCRKYYVCRNGVAVPESCEKGFYFDEVTNACNFPSFVTCSPSTNEHCTPKPTEPSSSAPSTEPPTTSTSEPTSTEAPTSPSTEPSTSTKPPTTTESSTSEPTISTESSSSSTKVTSSSETSTSSPGAECSNEPYCQASEHGTFHRDINDCRKYYVCRNGVAIAESCEIGFYFDEVANVCNYPSLVACSPSTNGNCIRKQTKSTELPGTSSSNPPSSKTSTSTSTSAGTPAPSTGTACSPEPNCQLLTTGSFYRDKNDCRKYYVCLNGIAIPLFCSPGDYFNDIPNAQGCIRESYVACTSGANVNCEQNEVVTTPSSTTSTTAKTSEKPTSTTTTMVANGQVNCKGLPTGTFIRDPVHCNVFYVCRNGMAAKHNCPYHQWFDDKRTVCNFRNLVDCPSRRD